LALDVLLDVHQQDAYAGLALDRRLSEARAMDGREKRLATELVYGVLENRIRLDYMLSFYLEREDTDPLVRDILRMGAYQLFFLDRVPGSAAVDESVKLARIKAREAFTGLVNAVLRTMIREPRRVTYPDPEQEPARFLSVTHSLPEWIVARLIDAYGPEEAEAIARHRAPGATVTVRPNLQRVGEAEFTAYLGRRHLAFEPGIVPGAYRVSRPGDLTQESEYQRGLFSIQGESSMLAALAVGARPGWMVLDACAAPGGKTALLAERLAGAGRVYAWDVHEHRVALLRAMVKRLHLDNVRPAVRDAAAFRQDLEGALDAVLVDAPCSGLGVMLNKPDVKDRQTPESVAALVKTQARILETCARYVKPGGVLVYATCSILPEENREQVAAFLADHPDFALEGLAERVPDALRARVDDGQLQLFAHRDGIDGFYVARMVRRKE
jgi:16S rRNA (cytosine967-C5)-methyltransferase